MTKKNIELNTIDDLKYSDYNPRRITDKNADKLGKSISEFGDISGIVWNQRTGNLVTGHQRLKQLKRIGVTLDKKNLVLKTNEGLEFPIRIVDWDEATEKAANIAANNPNLQGEFDDLLLGNLCQDLLATDVPFEITGFDWEDVDDILAPISPDPEPMGTDNIDTAMAELDRPEPISKRGEVYELGKHRLMCGDATSPEDMATLMGGKTASMVFTDPPYGVDYEGKTKEKLKIQNDKDLLFLTDSFIEMNKAMKEGCPYYICAPSCDNHIVFLQATNDVGMPYRQDLVWVKQSMVLGHSDYHYKHEHLIYGWKPGTHYFSDDRTQTSVWEFDRPMASKLHPTMKPVGLVVKAIENSSKMGDIVLDPFLGSGTTLIAAEQTGRVCYGMELDPHYCDVIRKRYANYKGDVWVGDI